MEKIRIMIIAVAAAAIVFVGAHDVMAREGGAGRGGEEGRGGEGKHGQGEQRRNYNNNYYEDEGWWGEEDDNTDEDNETVVVEPSPSDVFQDSTPAAAPTKAQAKAPIGAQVTTLPPGSEAKVVGGAQFYKSGNTWYKPYFGPSGVYYVVVSPPNE